MKINKKLPLRSIRQVGNLSFRENVTPPVTPLKIGPSGKIEIDNAGISNLLDHMYSNGVRAILTLGATGESIYLSNPLRKEGNRAFSEASDGRFKIFANVTGNNVKETMENINFVLDLKDVVAIVLAPLVYLVSVSLVVPHVQSVVREIGGKLPLILYNNPSIHMERVSIDPQTIAILSKIITAIKDSSGNIDLLKSYSLHTEVGQGNEAEIVKALQTGATFSVASMGNVVSWTQDIFKAETEGQMWEFQKKIVGLRDPLTANLRTPPGALKEALSRFGICEPTVAHESNMLSPKEKAAIDAIVPEVEVFFD